VVASLCLFLIFGLHLFVNVDSSSVTYKENLALFNSRLQMFFSVLLNLPVLVLQRDIKYVIDM
jgi:hypothetical protein